MDASSSLLSPAPSPVTSGTKPRVDAVDIARGIGIVLMVIGHTLRGLAAANVLPNHGWTHTLDTWIYAFHMPLFFALSGYLLPGAMGQRFGRFAWSRIVRLGYPYVIWAPLQSWIQIAASGYTNHEMRFSDVWRIVYAPPVQFWFLYTLLLASLLFGAMWKLGWRAPTILCIAALLLFTAPYLPMHIPWPLIYLVRTNLFYVACGAAGLISTVGNLPPRMRGLCAVLGLVLMTILAFAPGLSHSRAGVVSAVAAVAGIAATMSVAFMALPAWLACTLKLLGQRSMEIFLVHVISSAAVRVILLRTFHVEAAVPHIALGVLAGIAAPLVLHHLAVRSNFPYVFAWPARA